MKTYNVETHTIEVVVAAGVKLTGDGVLGFVDKNYNITHVFNKNEWKRVWVVE
jgi:hypothetical protein